MGKRVKIHDFTKPELDKIFALANFTSDEADYFWLRSKGKSIIQICFEMSISESKANTLSNKVNKKIIKVL